MERDNLNDYKYRITWSDDFEPTYYTSYRNALADINFCLTEYCVRGQIEEIH